LPKQVPQGTSAQRLFEAGAEVRITKPTLNNPRTRLDPQRRFAFERDTVEFFPAAATEQITLELEIDTSHPSGNVLSLEYTLSRKDRPEKPGPAEPSEDNNTTRAELTGFTKPTGIDLDARDIPPIHLLLLKSA
jgi:hypothetical protein